VSPAIFKVAGSETVGASMSQQQYIGPYRKNTVIHMHLSPGSVTPNSVAIQRTTLSTDTVYQWNWNYYDFTTLLPTYGTREEYLHYAMLYPFIQLETAMPAWSSLAISTSDSEGHFGAITYAGTNAVAFGTQIGKIDYRTGEIELDMTKLSECEADEARLEASLFRVDFSYRISGEWPQKFYLSKPDTGILREGTNYITAFIDIDANGEWTAGEPLGVATPVTTEVGWWKTPVEIEMTDTSSSMLRVDMRASLEANTYEAVNALTDRGVNGFIIPNSQVANPGADLPASSDVRVRIVRSYLNGVNRASWDKVVADFRFNKNEHPIVTEADILSDKQLDLDWGTVGPAFDNSNPASLTSAVYRVVINDGTTGWSEINNNLAVMFGIPFESAQLKNQSKCSPVSPAGIVDAGSPTFKWTHKNTINKDYPAFRLRIWDKTGKTCIYDSGNRRAPLRDSNGVYAWTAPVYAGMVTPQGHVFATTNNYMWSVSMLDAKFTEPNATENKMTFRMNASGAMGGESAYGSLALKVKYFGPAADMNGKATWTTTAKNDRIIRVEAFDSPDFSGVPVGAAYVTDDTALALTTSNGVNAVIRGLPAGSYYIRAYIDTNGNAKRDAWESWGYVNGIGTSVSSVYNPIGLTLVEGSSNIPEGTIYIEDMDVDNDGFPDIFEVASDSTFKAGTNVGEKSPASGNTFYVKVNTTLKDTLAAFDLATSSSSAYPVLKMMSTILSGSNVEALHAASILGSSASVTEAGVSISEFSQENMTLKVETETKIIDGTGTKLLDTTAPASVSVTWKLLYAPTLADEFVEVDRGTVSVTSSGSKSVNLENSAIENAKKSPSYNAESGFFKVTVE
jgi:hypothetical protein